jgi:uncharacterized Zn finger protein (UPF0148 family)
MEKMKIKKIAQWYPYAFQGTCPECKKATMKIENGGVKCPACGFEMSPEDMIGYIKNHPNIRMMEKAMDFLAENGLNYKKAQWKLVYEKPLHPESQWVKNYAQHILKDLRRIAESNNLPESGQAMSLLIGVKQTLGIEEDPEKIKHLI